MPFFIATSADAALVSSRPRQPRQCAPRSRPFPVAFLSALPAAAVHRLATGIRRLLRRARFGDGGHGRRRRGDADANGVSCRPLRRAALSGRRDVADDAVDRGDGHCHRLLAGGRAGLIVGGRQFGHPSGRLRDPCGIGGPGEIGPVLRLPYLCRPCRVRRGAAGDGGSGIADGLARCAAARRPAGASGGGDDPVAEPHPRRSGARAAPPRGKPRIRGAAAGEPVGADVLCLLHGVVDGRRRHLVLADHDPASGARAGGCAPPLRP